jgi:hypothetical protein
VVSVMPGMPEKSPSSWRWWLLAVGLAVAHFFLVMFISVVFHPDPFSTFRGSEPGWLYYATLMSRFAVGTAGSLGVSTFAAC